MYSFKNDYSEGAHSRVLEALVKNNGGQQIPYGLDQHSLKAQEYIRELLENNEADIHLISGGTQTNQIAISAFLRPHEACIAAESGHIATHEAGAIEATGHRILTVPTEDGKLTPELIEPVRAEHNFEHMVKPRMVYISNPTEFGTVYNKTELQALRTYCLEHNLLLYVDGARLGSALMVKEAELSLKDMGELTDAFFIGGTKSGALLGEALVIINSDLKEEYRYIIKQRGALLAKGRVMGIQFEELFRDGLYFELAEYANGIAQQMAEELKILGCDFWIESHTNQIFPIFKNSVIETLQKKYDFYTWAKVDEKYSAARLITTWATLPEAVELFINDYKTAISSHVIPAKTGI